MVVKDDHFESIKSWRHEYHQELWQLNQDIINTVGLGYSEGEKATKEKICDFLVTFTSSKAYLKLSHKTLERSVCGKETAFRYDIGVYPNTPNTAPSPVIFNVEYDGLEIGGKVIQACGHNLIAVGSISAFLFAARWLLEHAGKTPWRLQLIGTPSEEDDGAKPLFAEQGLYTGAKGCLMAHPFRKPTAVGDVDGVALANSIADQEISTVFEGVPAHSALNPWLGVNALDAAVLAYNSISVLRQQVQPTNRICPIINCDNATNIIPQYATIKVDIRAESKDQLYTLKAKVRACLEGAAKASGCKMKKSTEAAVPKDGEDYLHENIAYLDVVPNKSICQLLAQTAPAFDLPNYKYELPAGTIAVISTDQGNVTYACPGIHARFYITNECSNHTAGFADVAANASSLNKTISMGASLAVVACELAVDDKFAAQVKKDWEDDMQRLDPSKTSGLSTTEVKGVTEQVHDMSIEGIGGGCA